MRMRSLTFVPVRFFSLLGLNLCFHRQFFTLFSWFPNLSFLGNARTTADPSCWAARCETIVTVCMGPLYLKYVAAFPEPSHAVALHSRGVGNNCRLSQQHAEKLAFSLYFYSHPCTNTRRHTSARVGTAPSRRPFHGLTIAEEKRAQEYSCSHQRFHPAQGCSFSPPRSAELLSPSQVVNLEHLAFFTRFVTKNPGQLMMVFPSSFSEKKPLSDDCQRCGQGGSPKGG